MANFGTMTKPFHAGRAAHAGLMAARLAEAGFTASPDALEHPQGFLSAVSPAGDVDRSDPVSLGTEWRILSQGLGIKKYPTCYCTHRSIDAMLDLMQRQPLKPDDIKQMTVRSARILPRSCATTRRKPGSRQNSAWSSPSPRR